MGRRGAAAGRAGDDKGFLTLQMVVAVAFSLLLVLLVTNLVAFEYGRGVLRLALDEGVRTGSLATATVEDCEARARAALADLLGGELGRHVTVGCTSTPEEMRAVGHATFKAWIPMMPDWTVRAHASARRDPEP